MTTTGGKLWFGVSTLAFFAAWAFALGSDFEWFGAFVLGTISAGAFLLGLVSVATGDGDVAATADPAAAEVPARRSLPAFWPPLAAFGAGLSLIGLASHGALLYAGLGVLALVFLEWLVQGWAERATGDHEHNRKLRNQLMFPLEVPVVAALGVAFIVLSFSRVLLALPKNGSVIAAIGLALVVLSLATLISFKPTAASSVLTAVVVLGAVALLAGGIVGLVHGERHIEKHDAEHKSEHVANAEETHP
ncbi:MAG: hypothetical protein JF603_03335 [Acidobacteria bacterium]|nr:hypothetical protein [Acidobacteriota bacterium]